MIYIGAHSTYNVNDSYMGSGTNIKRIIKTEGKRNFTKEILHIFDNQKDMLSKEIELVTDSFIARHDTYNIILGGGKLNVLNCLTVKDKDGKSFMIHNTDSRYLSGELIPIYKNIVSVMDKNENKFHTTITDPKYISGEFVGVCKGTVTVKDKDNIFSRVSTDDPRYLSGDMVGNTKGKVVAKDADNNIFVVNISDSRYLSGELIHVANGHKHSNKTKMQMKLSHPDSNGENNNAFGRIWIYNKELNTNKFIKKEELDNYISIGWNKGTLKNRCWITKDKINKMIKKDELDKYIELGWINSKYDKCHK